MYSFTISLNIFELSLLNSLHKYNTSSYTISVLHSNNSPIDGLVLLRSE